MKNPVIKPVLIALAVLFSLTSCGGSDDDNPNAGTPGIEDTWKLDNYSYARDVSTQTASSYGNGNPFTVVNIGSRINNANGAFKQCNLMITFNTSTVGNYTLSSRNTLIGNSTQKLMHIKCTVTDAQANAVVYESADSSLPATVTQSNGKFVVQVNGPVPLTQTQNNGFPQAPQTFQFSCNNVR